MSICANFTRQLQAWRRYAHELRNCLRQSSHQLSEARQARELLNAQLDSVRMLLVEYERQRDEALAVVDQLDSEIQALHSRNVDDAAASHSAEVRPARVG